MRSGSMRKLKRATITHFGNIANNAFYNRELLFESGLRKQKRILEFTAHALSSPAWEVLAISGEELSSIEAPEWGQVAGAETLIKKTMIGPAVPKHKERTHVSSLLVRLEEKLVRSIRRSVDLIPGARKIVPFLGLSVLLSWYQKLRKKVAASLMKKNAGGTTVRATRDRVGGPLVQICYGPSAIWADFSRKWPVVGLEHGTVRWITKGTPEDRASREAYRQFVQSADHIWVTNLDDETLDNVESLAPGRWSALPHPYVVSAELEMVENFELQGRLRAATKSQFIVLKPSSWFWSRDHDKGALSAVNALRECRDRGLDVGLVTMEWGGHVEEAKDMLRTMGLSPFVHWIPPQSRRNMQSLIGNVDVVWDQFAIPAFGGVAFKTMEMGVPLVSRQIGVRAVELIGEPPPYLDASNAEELADCTEMLFRLRHSENGAKKLQDIGMAGRSWMERRHHHDMTALMQKERYSQLLGGGKREPAKPDMWSMMPDRRP